MNKNVNNFGINTNIKLPFYLRNHYKKPKELNFQNSSNFFTKRNYTETYNDYYQKYLNNNKEKKKFNFEKEKRPNDILNYSEYDINQYKKSIFPYLKIRKLNNINYLENYEKELRNELHKLNYNNFNSMDKKHSVKNMKINSEQNLLNRSKIWIKKNDLNIFKKLKKRKKKKFKKLPNDINQKIENINKKLEKLINKKDSKNKKLNKSSNLILKKKKKSYSEKQNNKKMDMNNLLTLKLIDPNLKIVI